MVVNHETTRCRTSDCEPFAPISVAILCGGASRRLGTDKALVSLAPGGPTPLELVVATARDLSSDVVLVGQDRPGYAALGVPVLRDRWPESGPLGGIATALAESRHEHCLVIACDMPFLSRPLLRAMSRCPRAGYDVLVPMVAETPTPAGGDQQREVPQVLHAIYTRRCLPAIERHLAAGHRRVSTFFPEVRVEIVDPALVREHDPAERSFFSINTPEHLRQARAWQAEVAGVAGDLL